MLNYHSSSTALFQAIFFFLFVVLDECENFVVLNVLNKTDWFGVCTFWQFKFYNAHLRHNCGQRNKTA